MNFRTRVKMCGITRLEDARYAVASGVDALGFVFYEPSPRNVSPGVARDIIAALPPFVSMVGLFLDAERDFVEEVLQTAPLDLLQFHGSETAAYCESFSRRYIKSIPMGGQIDPAAYAAEHPGAVGFLLDSNAPGERGGLGKVFDWNAIPDHLSRPLVLAGGLDPSNVGAAIARHRPYGVDVSSGVESSHGIKDAGRISAFMKEVEDVHTLTGR